MFIADSVKKAVASKTKKGVATKTRTYTRDAKGRFASAGTPGTKTTTSKSRPGTQWGKAGKKPAKPKKPSLPKAEAADLMPEASLGMRAAKVDAKRQKATTKKASEALKGAKSQKKSDPTGMEVTKATANQRTPKEERLKRASSKLESKGQALAQQAQAARQEVAAASRAGDKVGKLAAVAKTQMLMRKEKNYSDRTSRLSKIKQADDKAKTPKQQSKPKASPKASAADVLASKGYTKPTKTNGFYVSYIKTNIKGSSKPDILRARTLNGLKDSASKLPTPKTKNRTAKAPLKKAAISRSRGAALAAGSKAKR